MSSLAAREPGLSDYAASKLVGEQALIAAGDKLRWTILRPPAVYGPGDRATLSFFRCMAHGIGPVMGSDDARISLIHAGDLANAVGVLLAGAQYGRGRLVAVTDSGWIINSVLDGKGLGGVVIQNDDNLEMMKRLCRWAAGESE